MNPWSDLDTLAPQAATDMALFLEARALASDQQRIHQAAVAALDPQPGEHLLDLGCGSGVLARQLVTAVGQAGSVLGVDASSAMLDVANQRSTHPNLRYEHGQATALRSADAAFHAALAARLLMHVSQPLAVLAELRRVVRPDGRIVLLERDWGTVAVDHPDRALTRRILDWRCDTIDGNNWMGRQLVRLCGESRWRVRAIAPVVSVARDDQTTLLGSLRHAAELAEEHSIISPAEHQAWLGEIERRLAENTFFAMITDVIVIADRG